MTEVKKRVAVSDETIEEQWEILVSDGINGAVREYKAQFEDLIDECLENLAEGSKTPPAAFYELTRALAKDSKRKTDQFLLKGSLILNVLSQIKGEGRRLSQSSESLALYRAIFENEKREKKNVSRFCKEQGITRDRYYRIAKLRIKNEKDIELLESIKREVGL